MKPLYTTSMTSPVYVVVVALMSWINLSGATPPAVVTIGALFSSAARAEGEQLAFKMAVDYINSHPDILPDTRLEYIINETSHVLDTFENLQHACYQVKNGVAVIIGPASSTGVKVTEPVTSGLGVPHLAPFATDPNLSVIPEEFPYLIKMSSSDNEQSLAVEELIRCMGWTHFAILASATDYGRNGLRRLQSNALANDWVLTSVLYFYPYADRAQVDVRSQLVEIRSKGVRVVILNCLGPYGRIVLEQAALLGMTGKGWAWIATDGITAMDGFYDTCSKPPLHVLGLLGTRPAYGKGALYPLFVELWTNMTSQQETRDEVGMTTASCSDRKVACVSCDAYALRLFDAVLTAAYGMHAYFQDGYELAPRDPKATVCSTEMAEPWPSGEMLVNYMTKVQGDGSMNFLNFTDLHTPGLAQYEVVNLHEDGWTVVGDWASDRDAPMALTHRHDIIFPGDSTVTPVDSVLDISNATLRVVTILEEPFIMKTTEEERLLNPSVLYKGYCIDLLDKLRDTLHFRYELHLVRDGSYGTPDIETGTWNGIVGEILRDRADLAVAPMTISFERQQVLGFTKPFLDLGLVILASREAPRQDMLAFLGPFETPLWLAVTGSCLLCGIVTSCLSWISPYGYRGRYVQRTDDRQKKAGKSERNLLRIWDTLWFSFSCWMQQGADVSPRCLSGRIVHGIWWFTVMVITATYTANLAAFLTVKRLDTGINSLEDLANQHEIRYGTVANSATQDFFKAQVSEPYTKMFAFMRRQDTSVVNASEGIEMVRASYGRPQKERYAFIFDSALLQYAASNAPCVTDTVGQIFNQFGYGLALARNSPYVDLLSLQVLQLRESGYLESLSKRWIVAGSCAETPDDPTQAAGDRASLFDLAGVFMCLLVGIGVSFLVVLLEYCVAASRDPYRDKTHGKQGMTFCGSFSRRMRVTCKDLVSCSCQGLSDDDTDDDVIRTSPMTSAPASCHCPQCQDRQVRTVCTCRHCCNHNRSVSDVSDHVSQDHRRQVNQHGGGQGHEVVMGNFVLREKPNLLNGFANDRKDVLSTINTTQRYEF